MAIGLPRDLCGVPANPGMDQVQEQEKTEARKMSENGNESPPSSACCVSPHLIFIDMVLDP